MALITCPECSKRISDRAVECPHCGFPIGERPEHAGRTRARKPVVQDADNAKSHGASGAVFAIAAVLVPVLIGLMASRALAHGVSYMKLVWCLPCTIGCWFALGMTWSSIERIRQHGFEGDAVKTILGCAVFFVLALLLLANQLRLIE